jgi:hypothetical protein
MVNRNFRFSSSLAIRPNLWSNEYDIPEPANAMHSTPLIAAGIAGATLTLPVGMTTTTLGIEVGDIVYNSDYGSAGYGGYTKVATAVPGAPTITQVNNIGLATADSFMLFKARPSKGAILEKVIDFNVGDVFSVITFGGEYQTWPMSKGTVIPKVLTTRVLTINPYDSSNTPSVIANGYVLAQFA